MENNDQNQLVLEDQNYATNASAPQNRYTTLENLVATYTGISDKRMIQFFFIGAIIVLVLVSWFLLTASSVNQPATEDELGSMDVPSGR